MRQPPQGPQPSKGDVAAIRVTPPTAVARHPHRAGGRAVVAGPLQAVLTGDLALAVHRAMLALPDRTALILAMRFGIGPEEDEHTLSEIAEEVCLSKERVRQLEAEGLEELRWRLRKAV